MNKIDRWNIISMDDCNDSEGVIKCIVCVIKNEEWVDSNG
jgi:hypothetical protein